MKMRNAPAFLSAALLCGCVATAEVTPTPQFAPTFPASKPSIRVSTGSLFVDGQGDNLFGYTRNYQVGDILTVLLDEATVGARKQNTTTERKSSNDAFPSIQSGLSTAIGKSPLPFAMGIGSAVSQIKNTGAKIVSDGTGDHNQSGRLSGSISVNVVDVMSNGNLVIRGEKQLTLSEGSEIIQVSGIIRAADITPYGAVMSKRIANAQFTYKGSGDLANATQPAWGTRLLYRLWPF